MRALSSIEVTPLGGQRANGVLNFWREGFTTLTTQSMVICMGLDWKLIQASKDS